MAGDMESTDRQPLSGDGKGVKALGRLLAIAAAVLVLLGTVYTVAGQEDNAELDPRLSRFPLVTKIAQVV